MAFDTQLFYALNDLAGKSSFFDWIVVFFASYVAYVLIVFFLVLLFFFKYTKSEKLRMFLTAAVSVAVSRLCVTEFIRFFYHRPRPFLALQVNQLLTSNEWSFPSGHATFFFAMATAVYLHDKKLGIVFFVATVLMTASRVIAGIHYPSDIAGGAIIGVTVTYAVFYLIRIYSTKNVPL